MLTELAAKGIRRLSVVTPGFAADCVETLEEVAIRAAGKFRKAGGSDLAMVPCLNDSKAATDALYDISLRNLSGWH